MSMLSVQVENLRIMARLVRNYDYREISRALRDAADTIWQLRDNLQRANAAVQEAEHDESMAWDRVRKAEAENERLRELCADMWQCIPKTESCGWDSGANICAGYGECYGVCAIWYRMHELGIEVAE